MKFLFFILLLTSYAFATDQVQINKALVKVNEYLAEGLNWQEQK